MEPFLADLINNNKVPKVIRYLIVLISVGFCVWIGIFTGFNSEMLLGNIFGFAFSGVMLMAGLYLFVKIYKS